ncbi:MAG: DUF6894 family protein [Alphaproteobacteria bacterium]|jgi:hypothetical protein
MQYHFNIRHDGQTAIDDDPQGAEFPDVQAARSEALTSIREILADALESGEDTREGQMIVKDSSGETVLTIPFSMRVRLG